MWDPLSDGSPLITAAASGKLRLVRLLVEGGAQVNARNPRGETALLAACKALREQPAGAHTVKLLTYLLRNKADPNAQDRAGRTALMYTCMERAGAQVAATLLSAGADPSMEDHSGASALVYAINAQHQPTVEVLMEACQARGRDIIIITTQVGVTGGPVTRHYLNVPPSPNTSPVPCMSPSDIILKTSSPNSPEGENIFNFRGTSQRGSSSSSDSSQHPSCELSSLSHCNTPPPRQRVLSEPWLAIHNLSSLNRAYEEGKRERRLHGEGDREEGGSEDKGRKDDGESHFQESRLEERTESRFHRRDDRHRGENQSSRREDFPPRVSASVSSLTQLTPGREFPNSCPTSGRSTLDKKIQRSSVDKLPACPSPHSHSHLRRNTLPSVTVVPPLLHLPPLVNQSTSQLQIPTWASLSKSRSMVFLPHPPSSSTFRASVRPVLLPPLPPTLSVTSLVAPPTFCCSERGRRSLHRHPVYLEQARGGGQMDHLEL